MTARKSRAAAMTALFEAIDRGDHVAAIQLRAIARAADRTGARLVLAIALAVGLAACGVDTEPPVAWDLGVRPIAADGSDPMWIERVDAARDEWTALLAGCSVFDGSAGTQPVALVTDAEMVADTGSSSVIGWTTHARIIVEGTPDDLAHYPTYGHRTLVHEIGHALGLVHVAPADDPASVMHPIDDGDADPDAADVAAVRALLGC